MVIYLKEKKYQLTELEIFAQQNPFYSELKDFIDSWLQNESTFNFKTSGSTGKPKIIQIRRHQIESSVKATKEALNLNSTDKVLVCLNPDYIATKMMVARCLILDLDIHLIKPSSNPFFEIDEHTKIDFASFVPYQIETILKNNQANRLEKIRNILIGGAPINNNTIEKLSPLKNNIYQTYGMTETVSHIALMNIKKDTFFQAINGIKIKLDHRNCLSIKGDVTNSKWVYTNDIVELVNPSSFRWLGRIDNIINTGGIKIIPEELEGFIIDILEQNNYSNDFFIYGKNDDVFGNIICLVFEQNLPSKSLLKMIQNSIIQRFSKYHIPKKIFVLEKFVHTASNKINRKETINMIK